MLYVIGGSTTLLYGEPFAVVGRESCLVRLFVGKPESGIHWPIADSSHGSRVLKFHCPLILVDLRLARFT